MSEAATTVNEEDLKRIEGFLKSAIKQRIEEIEGRPGNGYIQAMQEFNGITDLSARIEAMSAKLQELLNTPTLREQKEAADARVREAIEGMQPADVAAYLLNFMG